MKEIKLVLKEPNGKRRVKYGKPGVSLDRICEIAECEVNGGYATYAAVYVDGELYIEVES